MKLKSALLILFISANLSAQNRLTLTDALNIGLENNYNLRISGKSVEISEENNTWGNAGLYPSIDISVTSVNRFDHSDEADVTTNNIAPSAQLNWTLFNGFRIYNTKSLLEDQLEQTKGFNAISVESTIQSIILSYYDVLLQSEKLKVFEELENLSKDRFERTEASKELGGSVTYEVLQAKTAWLEDRTNLLSQKLNYDNSVRALNLLIGEKEDKIYSDLDDFKTDINDYQLDILVDKMLSSNKTLKNQYLSEVISKRDIDIARSGMYPRLTLSAGYDFLNSNRKIEGFPKTKSESYDYYGNLNLSMNLFNGLNTRRSLEIAKIQSEISGIETEEMVHSMTNILTQLFELYKIQKELLTVAEENLSAAKLNLSISEERYRNGAINSFNYRDVQIVFLNASLQKLNSIYNLINTDTELARLTGSIITEQSE